MRAIERYIREFPLTAMSEVQYPPGDKRSPWCARPVRGNAGRRFSGREQLALPLAWNIREVASQVGTAPSPCPSPSMGEGRGEGDTRDS